MPSSKQPGDKEGGESERLQGKEGRVKKWGVKRMPSAEWLGEKEGGESERLKGKEGEEGVRQWGRGMQRMPWPSTAGGPVFYPSCISLSQRLSSCTQLTYCTPCEGRGWPPPSTGMGKKERGVSSKVAV